MKFSNLFTKFAVLLILQGVTTVHAQGGKLLSSQYKGSLQTAKASA